MGLIQQIKQFISPTGEVAQNDLPAAVGTMWQRHTFTPITDWNAAYHLWKTNPVTQACTLTYSLMMPEAQIGVITPTGYDFEAPIVGMLTRNQWRVTMAEVMTMLCIGGNAYGYKLRNASGAVIGLRWYSDKYFAPVDDGHGDIGHYLYTDGLNTYRIEKSDVVHIVGFWYDPAKPLGGGSPVELAAQSIEGYNEAAGTVFNIHKNDAMPKTLVIYDEELTTDQIAVAERTFKRKYGGERRGSVGHMWGVKDVKRLALDWSELGLSETFGRYETSVCGVYKVHPIIAGTHMGLSQSTYSNFEQASKDFTNMVRVPFWNMISDQINAQLALPDYGVQLGFDLSTVQALAGETIAVEAVSTENIDDTNNDDAPAVGGGQPLEARGFHNVQHKIRDGAEAVIVDIDNTLLTSTGEPNQTVIDYVNAKHAEYRIHIVTGRTIDDRERTERELRNAGVRYDDLHLNDTTAPTIRWKEYKAGIILESQPVDVAIDNDADTRAMYRTMGIDTLDPAAIDGARRAWLHGDNETYVKAYDEVLQGYADKLAIAWGRALDKLFKEITKNQKSLPGVEYKVDDFSTDVWTNVFNDETKKERNEIIQFAITAAIEEADAADGEFTRARDEGVRTSSELIAESVGTIKKDIQQLLADNPGASNAELTRLLESRFEELKKPIRAPFKQSRADVIGRTTATATTGAVQKNVWNEINPAIKRSWVALAGARSAHRAAHDTLEDENGLFNVGGETTPYPAGPGLSAKNSVNCRCFTRARLPG